MTYDREPERHLADCWFQIYGNAGAAYLPTLMALLAEHGEAAPAADRRRWDQRDVALITYGDQLRDARAKPLATLAAFLDREGLAELLNIVHLLPFYPASSDDGFSVIDYRAVDTELGSWEDVRCLATRHDLMVDLVLNHVSQRSTWFQQYLAGNPAFGDYFRVVDPRRDVSAVIRPRSLPLLTRFATAGGPRHVWTTFSPDQVDLNYAHAPVLLEILACLLFYIRQGARIIRLDAIAYLWKQLGTSCIHLPQTHAVVKLFRAVVDRVAPHVLLLTETNVPHVENVSYFGNGDEAHMVYQFSLPPLLLDALLHQDANPLNTWLAGLEPPPPGTTFFNFTASHDGIGVRPLEGLVSSDRLARLVQATQQRGGLVGTRRQPDGTDSPYELNITYVDALSDPNGELHARRFLASQALMLALRGIPGVYFHSLVGTQNDLDAVAASGIPRRINRRKFTLPTLDAQLARPDSLAARIYRGYRNLLATRVTQPAFHPDGPQRVWSGLEPALVAFERSSPDQDQQILVAGNVSARPRWLPLDRWGSRVRSSASIPTTDLLSGTVATSAGLELAPYQVVWLARR